MASCASRFCEVVCPRRRCEFKFKLLVIHIPTLGIVSSAALRNRDLHSGVGVVADPHPALSAPHTVPHHPQHPHDTPPHHNTTTPQHHNTTTPDPAGRREADMELLHGKDAPSGHHRVLTTD
eukprot:CAMPEP_0119538462 /NCGR_PEP_ID=MMETSP1344-20130328/50881_1 /TAXON_ID=236787 /ORGANISM="Florenciella parvula, Strain CCMP2471" /LENGTH=121 /DNA_ID=CAMNT_0007581367 /DNA_START=25 /DNA_END=386 /DNA_ORIENTATION=+